MARCQPGRSRLIVLAGTPCVVILLLATGCFRVPVHAEPQVEGPGGKGTVAQAVSIQPGKSTRQEVERDWKWCEVRTNLSGLFLCEVNRSTSRGVAGIIVMPVPLEVSRNWSRQVLFAEFDHADVVSKAYFVPDSHLTRELVEWLKQNPQAPLSIAEPLKLSAQISLRKNRREEIFPGWVQLGQDALVLQRSDALESAIQLRPNQLKKVNLNNNTGVSLLVDGLQPNDSHLLIELDVADRITFLRYLEQVQPAAISSP